MGIALDFEPTNIRDDDGRPAIPPHPGGMSGCGIWRTTAFAIVTIEDPLGQAGVNTSASSPGSSTQRIATLSACTPDAVTTISADGSIIYRAMDLRVGLFRDEVMQPNGA